jgi:hypothetical protein
MQDVNIQVSEFSPTICWSSFNISAYNSVIIFWEKGEWTHQTGHGVWPLPTYSPRIIWKAIKIIEKLINLTCKQIWTEQTLVSPPFHQHLRNDSLPFFHLIFTMRIPTEMLAETFEQLKYTSQHNPDSRSYTLKYICLYIYFSACWVTILPNASQIWSFLLQYKG